ncbi:MAG: hypothetical protein AAF844_12265 [Pseudomonadota bacterium]
MDIFFWIIMGLGAAMAAGVLTLFIRLRMAGEPDEKGRRMSGGGGGGVGDTNIGDGGGGGSD